MKETSQTLTRGLRLLNLIGNAGKGTSVRELADQLGLARTIVLRLLNSLEEAGFIEKHPTNVGYRLALHVWSLGCRAMGDGAVREMARPSIESLAGKTKEMAKLSILDGKDVVSLDKVDCEQAVRAYLPIGGRAPAHLAATGKAILAFRNLAANASSGAFSARVRADLAQVRKRGYAMNKGEWEPNVGAIAAPVFDSRGEAIASIGVIMPLSRLSAGKASQIGAWTVAAAGETSRRLGHRGNANSPLLLKAS